MPDLAVLLPPFGAWDPPGAGRVRGRARDRPASPPPPKCSWCAAAHDRRRAHGRGGVRHDVRPWWASIPHAGFHTVQLECGVDRRRRTRPRVVGRGRRARSARGRAPDVGHEPGDARARARRTRRSGCSSAGRSRRSRRSATGSRRHSSRSRRSTRRWTRPADEPNAVTAALAKATAGRTARDGRGPLPAGARRHRLHHRPSVPPVAQAHDAARRPLRMRPTRSSSTSGSRLIAERRVPTLIEL